MAASAQASGNRLRLTVTAEVLALPGLQQGAAQRASLLTLPAAARLCGLASAGWAPLHSDR